MHLIRNIAQGRAWAEIEIRRYSDAIQTVNNRGWGNGGTNELRVLSERAMAQGAAFWQAKETEEALRDLDRALAGQPEWGNPQWVKVLYSPLVAQERAGDAGGTRAEEEGADRGTIRNLFPADEKSGAHLRLKPRLAHPRAFCRGWETAVLWKTACGGASSAPPFARNARQRRTHSIVAPSRTETMHSAQFSTLSSRRCRLIPIPSRWASGLRCRRRCVRRGRRPDRRRHE